MIKRQHRENCRLHLELTMIDPVDIIAAWQYHIPARGIRKRQPANKSIPYRFIFESDREERHFILYLAVKFYYALWRWAMSSSLIDP